jgi:hypothetical protein
MTPLIQENAGVIDELLPSLERHFRLRMPLSIAHLAHNVADHAAAPSPQQPTAFPGW